MSSELWSRLSKIFSEDPEDMHAASVESITTFQEKANDQ